MNYCYKTAREDREDGAKERKGQRKKDRTKEGRREDQKEREI
jgi:hypothetical protein